MCVGGTGAGDRSQAVAAAVCAKSCCHPIPPADSTWQPGAPAGFSPLPNPLFLAQRAPAPCLPCPPACLTPFSPPCSPSVPHPLQLTAPPSPPVLVGSSPTTTFTPLPPPPPPPPPAANRVSFSSYPGELFSDDDFYILDSKLVIVQVRPWPTLSSLLLNFCTYFLHAGPPDSQTPAVLKEHR